MILALEFEGQLILLLLELFAVLLQVLDVSFGIAHLSVQLLVAIGFHMN